MQLDMNELRAMSEKVGKVLTPEERKLLGYDPTNDAEALEARAKRLVEEDLGRSVTLQPLVRVVDQKTLYPWYGKESDSEFAFSFESIMDAQYLYDFIVNTGLLEPGEIKLKVNEQQVSVHFASHVLVLKPEVIQAAMMAYYENLEESSEPAFNELAEEISELIDERVKVSGAPKKRAKGNPFHNKETGKFSGGAAIAGGKGGSFSSGKTKLKFAKAKNSKKGDMIVHFAATKHPCGRAARKAGKDVRCWDGGEGAGFRLSKIIKKRSRKEHISDLELAQMVEAIDYINGMAKLVEEELFEACKTPGMKKKSKGKGKGLARGDGKGPVGVPKDEDLEEGRKYHVLVGKSSTSAPWEIVFGDYDKNAVDDEKDDEGHNWKKLKIITVGSDDQKSIDAAVKKLNESATGVNKSFVEELEERFAAQLGEKKIPRGGHTGYSVDQLYNILSRTVKKGSVDDITMWHDELKAKGADMHIVDLIIRTGGKLPPAVKKISSLS